MTVNIALYYTFYIIFLGISIFYRRRHARTHIHMHTYVHTYERLDIYFIPSLNNTHTNKFLSANGQRKVKLV